MGKNKPGETAAAHMGFQEHTRALAHAKTGGSAHTGMYKHDTQADVNIHRNISKPCTGMSTQRNFQGYTTW